MNEDITESAETPKPSAKDANRYWFVRGGGGSPQGGVTAVTWQGKVFVLLVFAAMIGTIVFYNESLFPIEMFALVFVGIIVVLVKLQP